MSTDLSLSSFSQSIQSMSIFDMLGVEGTEEEKEAFLTQVQDVIWQDVVETDLAPLLSDAELDEVEAFLENEATTDDAKRDYLFGLIIDKVPDAESVLLTRTMQLKSDLLTERLEGMKEFFVNNAAAQSKLSQAEQLLTQHKHDEAVAILNELSASVRK